MAQQYHVNVNMITMECSLHDINYYRIHTYVHAQCHAWYIHLITRVTCQLTAMYIP